MAARLREEGFPEEAWLLLYWRNYMSSPLLPGIIGTETGTFAPAGTGPGTRGH